MLIEKSNEYNKELHLAFIDYSKAFDSVKQDFLIQALERQGIPQTYRSLIRSMYTGNKARMITDRKGKYFEVKKGVKQGDPMSAV